MQRQFYLLIILSTCTLASHQLRSDGKCIKGQLFLSLPSRPYMNLWKRGQGLDIDLNFPPPAEEVSDSTERNVHQVKESQFAPTSATVKKNIPYSIDAENQRKINRNKRESERRRKQRALWEEAVVDPSKMTPELYQQIDKHYESQRKRQKKFYDKVNTKVRNSTASQNEIATFHRHHRSIEWRSASLANEEYYQSLLKKERERKRKSREKKKQKLQKRALLPDIDLNVQLVDEQADEQAASSTHRVEQQAESQTPLAGQMQNTRKRGRPRLPADVVRHNETMRGRRWREKQRAKKQEGLPNSDEHGNPSTPVRLRRGRPRISAEVRRENDLARSQRWREKQKLRFQEALQDPSKMTEEVKAEMEKYKNIQKASSKKSYEKLKAAINSKAGVSPAQFRKYHKLHRSAIWRSASNENQAAYEHHLMRNRERSRNLKSKNAEVDDGKDSRQPDLRKRANDLDIDLNRTPPKDAESEEGMMIDTAPTTVSAPREWTEEQARERNRTRKRVERQKKKQRWKEAQADPTKMTPEISASIEKFKQNKRLEYQRRAKRQKEAELDPSKMTSNMRKVIEASKVKNRQRVQTYHRKLMQKLHTGQPLSQSEQKYYGRHYRTNEWREANKEAHDRHLAQRRLRYHAKQVEKSKDSKNT